MSHTFEDSWLSDDPLSLVDDADLFGRGLLVQRILEVLRRIRNQGPSTTIGLIGSWGSGKTTVLQELAKQVKTSSSTPEAVLIEQWSVAQFNPWLYSEPVSLHTGFFAELRSSLPKGKRWRQTRKNIASLGEKLAPLSALTGLAGISSEHAVSALLGQIKVSTLDQHKRVAEQLANLNRPILMIIDDLDRLTADELLQVFKLVRLVGRLPNVYYLLSYDEQTVIDLLSKTDLVSAKDDRRALDYLEKIVQVRLDVPALRDYEVDQVVTRSLQHIARRYDLDLPESEFAELLLCFDSVLSKRLNTPRAIKRYFGQIDAFLPGLGGEVRFGDFAILTWLRTFEPSVYSLVQARKNELLGIGRDSLRSLSQPSHSHKDARDIWLRRLKTALVSQEHEDDVLYLLSKLFPLLVPIYRGDDTRHDQYRQSVTAPARAIANTDYFDRYFTYGVPKDDIPESAITSALNELGNRGPAASRPNLSKLEVAFSQQPELVLRKVWSRIDDESLNRSRLVLWLTQLHTQSPQYSTIRHRIAGLVADIIVRIEANTAIPLMQNVGTTISGVHLWGMVRQLLAAYEVGMQGEIERRNHLAEALTPALIDRFHTVLDHQMQSTKSPFNIPAEEASLVWLWSEIDPDGLKKLFREAVTEERWTILDELAWMVPVVISSTQQSYISQWHNDYSHFAKLFDLDATAATLRQDVDTAGTLEQYQDTEATPEHLRAFALALLKYRRDAKPISVSSSHDYGEEDVNHNH